MALYRHDNDSSFKNYGDYRKNHVLIENEWEPGAGLDRCADPAWIDRYRYEAELVSHLCRKNGYSKILELGSGPGHLGQLVIEKNPTVSYSFIDKEGAKSEFLNKKFKGTFYVKNLNNSFDVSDLDRDYDYIIANDFLEHIANPSDILVRAREITKDGAGFLISVPNWRMGHSFIYRGLFDYDNFLYFSHIHGWRATSVDPSTIKCKYRPKLETETHMADNLINSWNWYFNFIKE